SSAVIFLPTPSARRATAVRHHYADRAAISTHALREEGDTGKRFWTRPSTNFYPRPPRGGRQGGQLHRDHRRRFLPTPSARRATWRRCRHRGPQHISTHALREEGDPQARAGSDRKEISTHALREEGDVQ